MIKFKQAIKNTVRNLLASQGYFILTQAPKTMDTAFQAIAKRNHNFNTVIDIGASNGMWSAALMKYFPQCQYLLVEAQPVHTEELNQFSNLNNNAHIVLAAAGENPGQIYFDASDPFGGQASYIPYESNNLQVPVTTIDHEIQTRRLTGPYLLKLDTHGFEVPILKGASQTLTEAEVIIIECYNFKIAPECLLFFEMCEYMKGLGFRCIDLVDTLHRPYDDSFWQMDLVFIKESRPEFSYLSYR